MRLGHAALKIGNQSGAIIVLFALLLVPLIAFVALTIDVGRMAEASSKTKETVGLASLGGLETYYGTKAPVGVTDPYEIHKVRLAAAIDRVEGLLSLSESATIGHTGQPLFESGEHELRDGSGALTSRSTDISGTVTPGQWFFSEPSVGCSNYTKEGGGADSSTCPCQGETKKWNKPCFRANLANETTITAMKIDYHTKDHNGISTAVETTFAKVLGFESVHFGVSTIAAVAPRALAFSIDNSRSMTFGNFIPYEIGGSTPRREAAEYVYPLAPSDPPCVNGANPCIAKNSCGFDTDAATIYRFVYNAMVVDGQRGASLMPSTYHYYDDYKCYEIDNNGKSERYLIASKIGYDYDDDGDGEPDGKYNGPEPLNSVLQGIYTVALSLEKVSVAGDKILAFSFDDRTPNDLTNLSADKRRVVGPTSVGESDFEELKSLVKVQGQTDADVQNRIEKLFFPLIGSSTDIPGAMAYALDQLSAMGASESLRMHTMFSDGVTNCSHRGKDDYQDFLEYNSSTKKFSLRKDVCMDSHQDDPQKKAGKADETDYMNKASHDSSGWGIYAYGNHIWSLWEANAIASRAQCTGSGSGNLDCSIDPPTHILQKEYLNAPGTEAANFKTYRDLGIKFNFVAVGDSALPHTILAQSPFNSNKCETDSEARSHGDFYVHYDPTQIDDAWDSYNSGNTEMPYALATAYMYQTARQTDGFYFPVRKPCNQVSKFLSSACRFSGGQTLGAYLDGMCASNHRDSDGSSASCPWGSSNVYIKPYTDACGRLTCDPECKGVGAQVEKAMLEMLNQNPFVLVTELN